VSCLHVYAERYAPLASEMRAGLEEFLATGTISGDRRLTAATGRHFNHHLKFYEARGRPPTNCPSGLG
jgi:hypothetical protein